MQAKDSTGGSVLHAVCTGGSVECLDFLMNVGGKSSEFTCKDLGGYADIPNSSLNNSDYV